MLGAGSVGAMQLRGRISVVPSGQLSPWWIVVVGPPRPPGRPVCAATVPARTDRILMPTNTEARIDAPRKGEETRRSNLSNAQRVRNRCPRDHPPHPGMMDAP